ncbi:hypothetical protein H5410_024575 [Solanum commersonii]|uniref:Uncharacterized protein n=1 Tax=Solanum commersonii TaxID=4109 RepID=A0A9J5ZMD6_SOLCO|nr:hypothetical protein H5410_024575 [Solanum commersonii]
MPTLDVSRNVQAIPAAVFAVEDWIHHRMKFCPVCKLCIPNVFVNVNKFVSYSRCNSKCLGVSSQDTIIDGIDSLPVGCVNLSGCLMSIESWQCIFRYSISTGLAVIVIGELVKFSFNEIALQFHCSEQKVLMTRRRKGMFLRHVWLVPPLKHTSIKKN